MILKVRKTRENRYKKDGVSYRYRFRYPSGEDVYVSEMEDCDGFQLKLTGNFTQTDIDNVYKRWGHKIKGIVDDNIRHNNI